jgi:hypothetical protein
VASSEIKPQVRAIPAPLACPVSHVRDEEAAGSNPATLTKKPQVTGCLVTRGLRFASFDVRFGAKRERNALLIGRAPASRRGRSAAARKDGRQP